MLYSLRSFIHSFKYRLVKEGKSKTPKHSSVSAREVTAPSVSDSSNRLTVPSCGAKLFFWVNIIVIDSLGTFCECFIRIISIYVYIACCFAGSVFGCGRSLAVKALLTEAALNGAVMLSLLMPCFILMSFRHCTEFQDWDILPIKTIMGDVDLRRYFVIVYGQGSGASNIEDFCVATCQDKLIGSCIFPPKKLIDSIDRTARGQQ